MSLEGNSTGSTRKAIAEDAIATTARYYGTDCVNAKLSNERIEETSIDSSGAVISRTFTADWEGYIEHRGNAPSYGFPRCDKCGKTDHRSRP